MVVIESTVEEAALAWRREVGYAVLYGPGIAAGEPAAERTLAALRDALLPKLMSGEIRVGAENLV